MTVRTAVFCAVWSGDPDRYELLASHLACLRRQTVPVLPVYVFDSGDRPPEWLEGVAITTPLPRLPSSQPSMYKCCAIVCSFKEKVAHH